MANELTNCGCAQCRDARRAIEPVLTRAEAALADDDRLDHALDRALHAGFDTDDGRWDREQALAAFRAALFPEGG